MNSTHKNSEGVRSVHLVGKVFVTKEEHHYIKKISKKMSIDDPTLVVCWFDDVVRIFFCQNCTYYSINPKSSREIFYIFLIKPMKKISPKKKILMGTILNSVRSQLLCD